MVRVHSGPPLDFNVVVAKLAQSVEQSAVNRSVVGSSPILGATCGLLEKRLNSHPFHGCIHGFESRKGHQIFSAGLAQLVEQLTCNQ